MKFNVITSEDKKEFTQLLEKGIADNSIIDIKYTMMPLITQGNSSGILYGALIMYENERED